MNSFVKHNLKLQVLAIQYSCFVASFTGAILCMNVTIDPDLVKTVQQDVNALKKNVDKLAFEEEVNRENLKEALHNAVTDQLSALQSEQEDVQRRVTCLEDQQNKSKPQISYGNSDKLNECVI